METAVSAKREVATLTWASIDLVNQTLTVPRTPTAVQQLSNDTWVALANYRHDYPKGPFSPDSPLLLATTRALNNGRGGHLIPNTTLNRITISKRVALLGKYLDYVRKKQVTQRGKTVIVRIGTLSARDCRHYCATIMVRKGYTPQELCVWFGWATLAMTNRYFAESEV